MLYLVDLHAEICNSTEKQRWILKFYNLKLILFSTSVSTEVLQLSLKDSELCGWESLHKQIQGQSNTPAMMSEPFVKSLRIVYIAINTVNHIFPIILSRKYVSGPIWLPYILALPPNLLSTEGHSQFVFYLLMFSSTTTSIKLHITILTSETLVPYIG